MYQSSLTNIVKDIQNGKPLAPVTARVLPERVQVRDGPVLEARLISPTNATLGFQTIQYINMAYRYDRDDSLLLQALVTGLELNKFTGVSAANLNRKGVAPISNDLIIRDAQLACYRSHANVWAKMLKENWRTMLVLEADAAWDISVKRIMRRFSVALNKLYETSSAAKKHDPVASEDDPYSSDNWDLLSLGHCFDGFNYMEDRIIYSDEDAQNDQSYFGNKLVDERVVRRAGAPTCTTAYALSQSGARKLLARAALDMNKPIDLMIADMVGSGQIVGYSVQPVVFAQLAYREGLGLNEYNSDVDELEPDKTPKNKEDKFTAEYRKAWQQAYKDRSVWTMTEIYKTAAFKNPAFNKAGPLIFEGAAEPDLDNELWWPDQPGNSVSIGAKEERGTQ